VRLERWLRVPVPLAALPRCSGGRRGLGVTINSYFSGQDLPSSQLAVPPTFLAVALHES
jgi:hypothetical protein